MKLRQLAVDDLKAVGASFSQLITATMISRLVLNLRSSRELNTGQMANSYLHQTPIKFMSRTIGNLGEEMESASDSDRFSRDSDIPMVNIRFSQTPKQ